MGPSIYWPYSFDGDEPYKTFLKWKKVYGPMFKVQFGAYAAVVLNDAKLIREAFNRPELCGRPLLKLYVESSKGKGVGLGNGPLVAEQRDFVIRQLKRLSQGAKVLEDKILFELDQLLETLGKATGKSSEMTQLFNISVINSMISIFLGQRFKHDDPELLDLVKGFSDFLSFNGILAKLSVFMPIISSVAPNFSGYNKQLAGVVQIHRFAKDIFMKPLPSSYIQGQPVNFKEAFIDQMRVHQNNPASSFHKSHNMFPFVAGETFMGSMASPPKTLEWFIIYMVRNLDVQQKMYEEIERVIGLNRLPSLSDRPNSPYVQAVLNETLRLSSVGPLGVLHSATQDTLFQGYTVKKNTMVISNLWGIHHDPDEWEEPEKFNPERFLDKQGKIRKFESFLPFSVGGRDCLGKGLARDTLFLYMVGLVQRFQILPSLVVPSLEGTPGVNLSPKPFQVIFQRRSEL